jgi:predicted signal transduction protein with EAL and GGDEF domain
MAQAVALVHPRDRIDHHGTGLGKLAAPTARDPAHGFSDEFVILVPELPAGDHLQQLAQTLMTVVSQPHEVMGVGLSMTVSIGMAIYPDHGETVDALLHSADTAMYCAKRDGPPHLRFADQRVPSSQPADLQ